MRSIRGFNGQYEFVLGERLTIIGGANGSGKSSLSEAWDWVYSNQTIAEYLEPRNELKQGFKSLHSPIGQTPRARIDLIDGTHARYIERSGSGVLAHDLPVAPPMLSPVILQYRLQRAIYTSDSDRATFFTTVLGLEAALKLVKRIEGLQRLTEKDGAAAAAKWATLAGETSKLGHTFPHPLPKSAAEVSQNEGSLIGLLAPLVSRAATEADVIAGIKAQAHATTTTEVSVDKLVPMTLLAPDAATSLQAGIEAVGAIIAIDKESAARSRWLDKGLKAAQPPACPFCGESTLSPDRIQAITRQKDEAGEAAAALDRLESAITRARALTEAGNASTIQKLETELGRVAAAAAELDDVKKAVVEAPIRAAQAALQTWKALPNTITEELRFAAAIQFIDAMNKLHASRSAMDAALQERLRPITIAKVKIASLLYLEDPSRKDWKKGIDDAALLSQVAKIARDEFDALVQASANEVRDEIIKWYKVLRPHDTTPLAGLDIETGKNVKVRVFAETHGVTGPASAIFSHSNVNALGMACHLARLLKAGHTTVVLDDPTQALDPDNRFTFERDFVRALLNEGLQVVILTHDTTTARSLWDEYQAFDPTGYSFEAHSKDGPLVRPLYGDADHLIRRALDALESGDNARTEEAALAVRKLGEQAVAEYLKHYNSAFPQKPVFGNLLQKLDALGGGKTPMQNAMQRLNEICNRISTPLHHPQTGQAMTLPEVAADLREIINLRKQPGHLQYPRSKPWPITTGVKERLDKLAI